MSPDPYIRGQSLAFAVLVLTTAVLGSPLAALICAASAGLLATGLSSRYRGDLKAHGVDAPPPHRDRLDLVVAGDVRSAVVAGVVAGSTLVAFPRHAPSIGVAPVTWLLLAVGAAGVLLSSLFDWYVILPRLTGLLGPRPCRNPDSDFHRFPRTWRETTRWWYVHRIIAAIMVRYGIAYAAVATLVHNVALPGATTVLGGLVAGFFASYVAAVPRAVWEAGHPTLTVGRTIRLQTVRRVPRAVQIRGRQIRLPGRSRQILESYGPRQYVYDVALETVELVNAGTREHATPRDEKGRVIYERNPEKIKLRDIQRTRPKPGEPPYAGCSGACAGINWYCIENPRCFHNK